MKTINHKIIIFMFLALPININSKAQDENKTVVTSEFHVDGVCGQCKARIENAALINGVKMAEWDKETGMLKVAYRADKVTLDKIHNSIAAAGHDTDKVKAGDEAYDKLPGCCAYRDNTPKH